MAKYLLLDIGGTFIKGGASAVSGEIVKDFSVEVPIDSTGTKEEILGSMRQVALLAKERLDDIEGVGITMPGPFDYGKGISLMQHKFQSIYGCNLKEFFAGIFSIPAHKVAFCHDVTGLLLGELLSGAAQGYRNVAIITLGTGLGFSHAVDGKIAYSPMLSPARSLYTLPYKGETLEDFVSKRGFLRAYAEAAGKPNPADLTVKDIAMKAGEGDPHALAAFEHCATILADAIAPILQEYGIECLLFGGQISKSLCYMLPTLQSGLSGVSTLKTIAPAKFLSEGAIRGAYATLASLQESSMGGVTLLT